MNGGADEATEHEAEMARVGGCANGGGGGDGNDVWWENPGGFEEASGEAGDGAKGGCGSG